MPLLHLFTNVQLSSEDQDRFLRKASAKVSEGLGKSEDYVMVMISPGKKLFFAGSDEPAAFMELKSIGLPEVKTAELSAILCELVEKIFSIPPERIYIEFSNAPAVMWGWNSQVFG